MATILRQLVSSPRARHPEARLDLCYVTDNIVVTSGPSSVWPRKAYRNPVDQLVAFLDKKHDDQWAIFEFRAEGTGYPDSEVYNRVHHFPWPDHHPPPFAIIPNLMAVMRNWLQKEKYDEQDNSTSSGKRRVAVVHCKAGKGRSGTVACSYLVSEEGWRREDALHRFTIRRMRAGFGHGVSIPSQLRWVGYVDRWTNEMGKKYEERPVEIIEVHLQGLRDGVKVSVEGFVDDGRGIQTFHTYTRADKKVIAQHGPEKVRDGKEDDVVLTSPIVDKHSSSDDPENVEEADSQDVILKTAGPIRLLTSDINIDFERRNRVKYTGYTYVTSIAHVWFNAWFEGGSNGADSGVFEIKWEEMDGIKGSVRKGVRAFDKMQIVWRYVEQARSKPIDEPQKGEPVPEGVPTDWKNGGSAEEAEAKHSDGVDSGRPGGSLLTMGAMIQTGAESLGKELGLRKDHPRSGDVSRANSVKESPSPAVAVQKASEQLRKVEEEERAALKSHGVEHEDADYDKNLEEEGIDGHSDTGVGRAYESGMSMVHSMISKVRGEDSDAKEHLSDDLRQTQATK